VSPRPDPLALRKALLISQSALHRSRLRYEVAAVRSRGVHWIGRAGAALALVRTVLAAITLFRK
jgi:hypothetical protein